MADPWETNHDQQTKANRNRKFPRAGSPGLRANGCAVDRTEERGRKKAGRLILDGPGLHHGYQPDSFKPDGRVGKLGHGPNRYIV